MTASGAACLSSASVKKRPDSRSMLSIDEAVAVKPVTVAAPSFFLPERSLLRRSACTETAKSSEKPIASSRPRALRLELLPLLLRGDDDTVAVPERAERLERAGDDVLSRRQAVRDLDLELAPEARLD